MVAVVDRHVEQAVVIGAAPAAGCFAASETTTRTPRPASATAADSPASPRADDMNGHPNTLQRTTR